MMKRLLLALALLLAASPALAQTSPGLVYGQTPTAAQWNSYFAAKQDYSAAAVAGPGAATTGNLVKWGVYPNVVDGGAPPTFIAGTGITKSGTASCVGGCTFAVSGGGGSVANPTATIGLTAVNGVATSAIRSDGAPALSQAIVPTWTGVHTFSASPVFNGAGTPTFATPANWRTALGLGTMATQAASSVAITGGSVAGITDLAVADGGTGASTAAAARTNLGVGMTKIGSGSTVAASSGWITGLNGTYSKYKVFITGYRCSSSGATSYLRISNDNRSTTYSGSTYYGAGYDSRSSDGTPSPVNTNAGTSIKLTNDMTSGVSTSPGQLVLDISTSGTEYFSAAGTGFYQSSASGYRWEGISGMVDKFSITDLLLGCSAGNISFVWTLYAYL